VAKHATEELRRVYLPKLVSGAWSGTMVLTEPHAGTDLGLMRTRAQPDSDGSYRISGTKIFITSGEHDLTENIVHLVLAKLPDAPPGSRGISLFLVPKRLPDGKGAPGALNGVTCPSVEHKLGIHGSATCVMNFDNSRSWLIGEINGGLKVMFTMMNHARLWVGLQGLAQCERAWQPALAYARERRQGRSSEGGKAAADPIIGHPDVRRMLLTQRSLIEGARVLIWFAGMQMDRALHHPDAAKRAESDALLAILTPIAKGFVTDMSLECTSLAIQIHGGHGYVRETGIEQYFRDARITAIYEGANGVQAMDLLGRKVLGSGGALARQLGGLIGGFCERHAGSGELSEFIVRRDRGDRSAQRAQSRRDRGGFHGLPGADGLSMSRMVLGPDGGRFGGVAEGRPCRRRIPQVETRNGAFLFPAHPAAGRGASRCAGRGGTFADGAAARSVRVLIRRSREAPRVRRERQSCLSRVLKILSCSLN
jgi:hypothetical protein